MKQQKLFLLFLFSITFYLSAEKPLWDTLARQNMQSVAWEEEDWPNEPFYDFLMRALRYQQHPQEAKKRRIAFNLIKQETHRSTTSSVLEDIITWKDLQLFFPKEENQPYLAELVDRTSTQLGKVALYGMIAQPSSDIEELKKRQKIIKELIENTQLYDQLKECFDTLHKIEPIMLSFWAQQDPLMNAALRHYFSIPYFKNIEEWANRNESLLLLPTWLSHNQRALWAGSTAIAACILPVYATSKFLPTSLHDKIAPYAENLVSTGGAYFNMLRNDYYPKLSAGLIALSGATCALGAKEMITWTRDNFVLDQCLQTKLIDVASYLHQTQTIAAITAHNSCLSNDLDLFHSLIRFFTSDSHNNPALKKVRNLLKTRTFSGNSSFISHLGRILAAYKLMHDTKELFVPMLQALAEIDAYLSIATLFKEYQSKKVSFCFVEYKTSDTPYIHAVDFYNPFINPDIVVSNSLELGNTQRQNVILTGPNAGGKSTIIKALTINVILAQAFGIAPAQSLEITPFDSIMTYLNITDDIAAGNSLFKAQVLRAHAIVEKSHTLQKNNQFMFIAIDEMFNGTSTKEAKAAAYSVAKHLGMYSNCINIIATHFPLLTTLEHNTNSFTNYKVSVEKTKSGLHYPYKLYPGISNQRIALDILEQEGFSSSITEQAAQILKKFQPENITNGQI